jgi:ABC-2 type transport system ATP-binding protein
VLREAGLDVQQRPDGRLEVGVTGRSVSDASEVSRLLGERGLWVHHLAPAGGDLESAFLEITAGGGLDDPARANAAPPPSEAGSAGSAESRGVR